MQKLERVRVSVCIFCAKQCSEELGDLSGGVEVATLWQCDRAGLSLPVMDEHSQGEHLSFLSSLSPPSLNLRVLFSTGTCHMGPITFACVWATVCERRSPVYWYFAVRFCIFLCFWRAAAACIMKKVWVFYPRNVSE